MTPKGSYYDIKDSRFGRFLVEVGQDVLLSLSFMDRSLKIV